MVVPKAAPESAEAGAPAPKPVMAPKFARLGALFAGWRSSTALASS